MKNINRAIAAIAIIAAGIIPVSGGTVEAKATGCKYTSTSYGAYAYCSGTDGFGNGNWFTVLKTCIRTSGSLQYVTVSGPWRHAGMGKASRAYCPDGYAPTQGSAWMLFKNTN